MAGVRDSVRVPTLTVSYEDKRRVKGLGFVVNKHTDNFSARIVTTNGKVTAEQVARLADAAEKYGSGEVTLTSRLTFEIIGIPYEKIDEFIEYIGEVGLQTGGTGSVVRPVVACKGTVCRFGLIDTFKISEEAHNRFYEGYRTVKLPHKFKIAVGGCPNNCVKPTTNDLAVVGQYVPNYDPELCIGCKKCNPEDVCPMFAITVEETDEGRKMKIDEEICNNCGLCIEACPFDSIPDGVKKYKMALGGRWGKFTNEAFPMETLFSTEEEVLDVIEKMILIYREQGVTGERMSHTVQRIGMEDIEKQLLSDDIMARKQEILDAPLHLVGGAKC